MEYGATAGPREIADFLILDRRMPRSLAFCVRKLHDNLGYLNRRKTSPGQAQKMALHIKKSFLSHDIGAVFEYDLHEHIQQVLAHLADLSAQIETDFRFYE